MSHIKLSEFSIKWINNLPKIINNNGCWIPTRWAPLPNGYVHIQVEKISFLLHRLVVSIYCNLDYHSLEWDTRHNKECSHACFNPEHLKPGTASDNIKDSVEHGTQKEARKKCCPKCKGEYKTRIIKSGYQKGQIKRYCPSCSNDWNRKWQKRR